MTLSPAIKRNIVTGFGIAATVVLLVSVFLLVFVRTSTTTIIPAPTTTPTPSFTPLAIVGLGVISQLSRFTNTQLTAEISPVASIAPPGGIVQNSPYPFPPNQVAFSTTRHTPLQQSPQGMGFVTMNNTATQLLTSLQNGEVGFGVYTYQSDTGVYKLNPDHYSNGNFQNRVIQTVPRTTDAAEHVAINQSASAVGCIGQNSIIMSDDELVLYVAYRDGTTSPDSYFPLGQVVGKVQVWTRVPSSTNSPTLDDWSHSAQSVPDIVNPFGSQVVGLAATVSGSPQGFNSFTETFPSGDEFGTYMKTSTNFSTGARTIAVGSNSGIDPRNGRCICIFEEQNNFSYKVIGVLSLPIGDEFSPNDRSSFGHAFDFVDDTCLASIGSHAEPDKNRLAYFRRRVNTDSWEFVSIILPPSESVDEFFGTSIVISGYNGVAIIGSPSSLIPSIGGSVYIMVRNNLDIWTFNQTVTDPWATNTEFPNTKNFGWFVHTDPSFTVLCVTGNQDSEFKTYTGDMLLPPPDCTGFDGGKPTTTCQYTNLVFFSIDQNINKVLMEQDKTQRLYQQQFTDGNPTEVVDPLFGATVAMTVLDHGTNVMTGTPMNNTVTLFLMGFT